MKKFVEEEAMKGALLIYLKTRAKLINAINEEPPEDVNPWSSALDKWGEFHEEYLCDCRYNVRDAMYELINFIERDYIEINSYMVANNLVSTLPPLE